MAMALTRKKDFSKAFGKRPNTIPSNNKIDKMNCKNTGLKTTSIDNGFHFHHSHNKNNFVITFIMEHPIYSIKTLN